jgi:CheY-specific phosphatase CheX
MADKIPESNFDETIAPDLHHAVEKTLGQMFNLRVDSTFTFKEKSETITSGDVYGSVSIIHDRYLGSMVVAFPQKTLFSILKALYKRDFTEMDRTTAGAVGELTNIIFAVFKHRLNEKGFFFKMAIPQTVTGGNHRVPDATWTLDGHFTCPAGEFHVYVIRAEHPPV